MILELTPCSGLFASERARFKVDGTAARSWTFDGGEAKVVWDGKDALGAYAADGEYKVKSEGGNPVNGTF